MSKSLANLILCVALVGCNATTSRHISGTLVSSSTGNRLPHQALVLDRPPGNYVGNPIVLFGWVPQQVTIASTNTDEKGNFSFATTKDRGQYLLILLDRPLRFSDYSVVNLQDSAFSNSPRVSFSSDMMHSPSGGFEISATKLKAEQ